MDSGDGSAAELDVESLLQELETCGNRFPEAALRQCQQHRELVIPYLIRAIEQATERARAGEDFFSSSSWLAGYLLWEFEAKEALPAILNALRLPGAKAFDLFGDSITEDFGYILATLAGDQLEIIDALIDDEGVDEYVRSAAMKVYPLLVRDQVLTREEGVERLRRHLRTAIDRKQASGTDWLICELCGLNPQEAAAEINEAFDRNLVDDFTIQLSHVEDVLRKGTEGMQKSLSYLRPTRLDDAAEYLRELAFFQPRQINPENWDVNRRAVIESFQAEPDYIPPRSNSTIRNEDVRIGRNDPCPCGSGKKFKKCCLRKELFSNL